MLVSFAKENLTVFTDIILISNLNETAGRDHLLARFNDDSAVEISVALKKTKLKSVHNEFT